MGSGGGGGGVKYVPQPQQTVMIATPTADPTTGTALNGNNKASKAALVEELDKEKRNQYATRGNALLGVPLQ